jgi:D-alanine-D-alanine ligase-like ATP-grasp enzyme
MFIVKRKNLPNTVFPLIKRVQRTFEVFKRKIYTIDLMFDKSQKPWIVELNTMPGIYFSPDQKKWQSRFYLELIKIFKEEIEEMQD